VNCLVTIIIHLKVIKSDLQVTEREEIQLLYRLKGKDEKKSKMLLAIFTGHNQQMVPLIERKEYAKGTSTHFETTPNIQQALSRESTMQMTFPLTR